MITAYTLRQVTTRSCVPVTFIFLATLISSGCGTKYTAGNNRIPEPILLPGPAEQPTIEPDAAALPSATVIVPTKLPDTNQPRSLPAALALRKQALAATEQNNHTRAIGLLERAIRISPKDPDTFKALAENHLAMNRPEQALELTRRALSLNPTPQQRQALNSLAERCLALL